MNNDGWKGHFRRFCKSLFQELNLALIDELAIDLGAANTRVYLPGAGLVVNEPSVIAYDSTSGRVAAVGREAKRLARRQPREIRIARPIKDGVIADCESASQMLSQFINLARGRNAMIGPSLLICAPTDATPLEQRAYEDTALLAGAGRVTLIEGPYAAALGADLDPRASRACMIVDIGAATTDIAVISGGGILYASTRRIGGCEIDRAIARYLQLERTLEVGVDAAEDVKIEMGAGNKRQNRQGAGRDKRGDSRALTVRGRNLKTGLPEEIAVGREEIDLLIQPALRQIKRHIRLALEEIPAEASVDLLDSGILLSGGLAQLDGLAEEFTEEFGVRVRVAPDPTLAAALGAGLILERTLPKSRREALREEDAMRIDYAT